MTDEVNVVDEGPNPTSDIFKTISEIDPADAGPIKEALESIVANEVVEPIAVPVEEPKKTEPVVEFKRQHNTQHYSVNANENITNVEKVYLPSDLSSRIDHRIKALPNVNQLDSEDGTNWAGVLAEGIKLTTVGEMLVDTVTDDTFTQKPEHNNIPLIAGKPISKRKSDDVEIMSGEAAVISAITYLGMGSLFQAPMWHSGIWITFKPPTESELIELNRQMANDKISLGRYSYGLLYSNLTAYTVARLVDFAKDHIYSTSVMSDQLHNNNIKAHLDSRDLFAFLWGFATTMYPRGINYQRGCISDPEKCKHVVSETLNVTKLQWTNPDALTDWQKSFMSNRSARTQTLDNVKRYKTELARTQNKRFTINKDSSCELYITLKSPTLEEYVETGQRWIGDITSQVESMLGSDSVLGQRNAEIIKHGQASIMRQYSHWVESIEYDKVLIKDRETIENTLSSLSGDDVIRADFQETVSKYINESTMSVIGIPVYNCPVCGTSQETEGAYPRVSEIIPLDVIQLFFALLSQRIEKIIVR